jgi:hypothetical protein
MRKRSQMYVHTKIRWAVDGLGLDELPPLKLPLPHALRSPSPSCSPYLLPCAGRPFPGVNTGKGEGRARGARGRPDDARHWVTSAWASTGTGSCGPAGIGTGYAGHRGMWSAPSLRLFMTETKPDDLPDLFSFSRAISTSPSLCL